MAGDDGNVKPTAIWAKTVTRELRAMMRGRVVSPATMTILARGRYGTGQSSTSRR